jgi:Fe-S-cluster containining protein
MNDFQFSFNPSACQTCEAKCCRGESGIVNFSKDELSKMADFLKISEKDFLENFCRKNGYKWSLKELKISGEFHCVFLENNSCTIYEVRPKQCRDFPFWSRYKNGENFDELKKECIGIF